ncbi:uncharacterized protein LOC134841320, partial [Symsagittifera roscoffensis]|uniref:uncharacterized protein LOC134841320 n=1 Tax=Symsagittifera roscoffensis TaxID=84072 RepID=UPI00307B94AE
MPPHRKEPLVQPYEISPFAMRRYKVYLSLRKIAKTYEQLLNEEAKRASAKAHARVASRAEGKSPAAASPSGEESDDPAADNSAHSEADRRTMTSIAEAELKGQQSLNDVTTLRESHMLKLIDNFMPHNVQLITTVFYGGSKVRSIAFTGSNKIVTGTINHEKQGRKEFDILVSHEKFHFSHLDPSAFGDIDGARDVPAIIIRAVYVVTDEQIGGILAAQAPPGSIAPRAIQLGYARVDMWKREDESGRAFWEPPFETVKVDLTPGYLPPNISSQALDNNQKFVLASDCSYIECNIFRPDDRITPSPSGTPRGRRDQIFPKRTFWTPFNLKTLESLPAVISNQDDFDIYIDQVRFLPDNCRICKVTGRIFKSELDLADLEAFPDLDSDARSPLFHHRSTLRAPEGEELDPFSVLVLRVYIRDIHSTEMVVCGSGALTLYNINSSNSGKHMSKGWLNVGG